MLKSISAKFSASLITVIALGVVVGVMGIINSQQIMKAGVKNDFTHEIIENVLGVRENLLNIETGERGFLLRADESYLAPYEAGKVKVIDHYDKALGLTTHNAVVQENLRLFKSHYDSWLSTVIDPLIAARRLVNRGEMTQEAFEAEVQARPGKPLMDRMRTELAAVEAEEFRLLELRKAASEATYQQSIWMVSVLTLVALVTGLLLNFAIARMFKRKVSTAAHHINELAEGRLNSQIKVMGQDEVDGLLTALAKAQTNLCGLIDNIRNTTGSLATSASVVQTSSGEMSKAATEQAEATASMAAAVEQLTVSIGQITENATEASHTAMEAKASADEGIVSLNEVVDGIRQIASSVQDSASTVRSLEEQSNEISEIISTITNIADRTNLLALNAAIEAARAGESGRGFAVVADEVRKLAEQTKGSSERISSMVFQIQNITQEASRSMDESVERVQHGIEKADTVSGTITRIKSNADRVNQAISAISVSMKEQSNVSVEISRNVERVAQMTEENTASIEQNTQVSVEMADLSDSLAKSVAVFKTA